MQSAIFAFDKAISLEKNGKILIEFAQFLFTLANRIPETADKNKEKDKQEKMSDNSDESDKLSEKTDFEMLKKSESLFDQVKESMPEEEWLVLYMKGRVSRTKAKYAWTQKANNSEPYPVLASFSKRPCFLGSEIIFESEIILWSNFYPIEEP